MLVRKLLRPVPKRLPHAIEIEAYLSLALFGFTLVACAQRDRNLHSLCTNDGLEDLVPHRNGERCASSFAQDILRNTLSELNEGGTGTPHWGSHLICTVYHPCVAVGERITQKYQKDERNQYVLNGMVPRRGLEPPHPFGYQHLKLARLPIPPSGRRRAMYGRGSSLSTGFLKFPCQSWKNLRR